jgi:hypothetical protein
VEQVASGPLVTVDGREVGSAALLQGDRLVMLVQIDNPQPFDGERICVIVEPDGTTTEVGGWTATGIASGAWSVAIDDDLADAERMEVRNEAGDVLSTAEL